MTNEWYMFKHPDWGVGTGAFPNDIALVEFDEEVDTKYTGAVLINDLADVDYTGIHGCYITGWGSACPSCKYYWEQEIFHNT